MKKALLLAALLLSCVHGRAPGPEEVCEMVCSPPKRIPPAPREPEIDWMPAGCPSAFGACLSGADAAKMLTYMRQLNRWKRVVQIAEGLR